VIGVRASLSQFTVLKMLVHTDSRAMEVGIQSSCENKSHIFYFGVKELLLHFKLLFSKGRFETFPRAARKSQPAIANDTRPIRTDLLIVPLRRPPGAGCYSTHSVTRGSPLSYCTPINSCNERLLCAPPTMH